MNILVVDDEPIVLEGLCRVLRSMGSETWDVQSASSGSKALEVMANHAIDLIITDMRMPGMDGADLLAATADRHPKITRFVLTAEANEQQAIRAAGLAHQYLGKPCPAKTLIAAIDAVEILGADEDAHAILGLVSAVPKLPSLPSTFIELRALLESSRSSVRSIADVIRQDPGITAKVMQLASSSFFFRGSPISDVPSAVARLGASLISRLVLVEGLVGVGANSAPQSFADEARLFFQASLIAEAVVPPAHRDAAALAALLCPIGKMVMHAAAPARFAEATSLESERALFGTNHAAVGAYLVALWGLSPLVGAAIAAQHLPAKYVDGDDVLAATLLTHRDVRGSIDLPSTPHMTAFIAAWDLHRARLAEGGR